jgi:hypothetical protein
VPWPSESRPYHFSVRVVPRVNLLDHADDEDCPQIWSLDESPDVHVMEFNEPVKTDGCWRILPGGYTCGVAVPKSDGLGLCQSCRDALRDA